MTAVVWLTVGVPEMTPFAMLNPAGRVGAISQVATLPPELVATMSVIVMPLVNVWSAIGDKLATGSLIMMLNETLSVPPELFAYNVYETAVVWFTVGVPEITPFVIDRPAGKVG